MCFWDSVAGYVKCRLVSASLGQTINIISFQCNITNLTIIDDLTATFWISRHDLNAVKSIDDRIEVIGQSGIIWTILRLSSRPVIITGMLLILFLVFYLPTRILFISVDGNHAVSDTQIFDAAQNCGVVFGASRELVRSEKVKNALLQSIPQLQWACINTSGCVAKITVQERTRNVDEKWFGTSNIVASRDGIITNLTVYSGTPTCRVGQVVKKGQLLVSGYSDLGLLIKNSVAEAEIIAETTHSVNAVTLSTFTRKVESRGIKNRYSLLLGKKLIKFYKDSGILPSECGRINKIYNLTLPGGYRLPVAVVKEQVVYYKTAADEEEDVHAFGWLKDAADASVRGQMIAGEILKQSSATETGDELCCLRAYYRCREMIAVTQKKELDVVHGKRD